MRRMSAFVVAGGLVAAVGAAALGGCGGGGGSSAAPAPACDAACQDAIAFRALRDAIKFVYNIMLAGNPVGEQDAGSACPFGGGDVRVSGEAVSDASQGTTHIPFPPGLTYVFDHCGYLEQDSDPSRTFTITLTGTITESGEIAAQSTSTTALKFDSDSMSLTGAVSSPAIPYSANADGGACAITLTQNGNDLSGTLCGRPVGLAL